MILTVVVLSLVTLQRLGELFLARRNTAGLLEQGGVEKSPGHYPLIMGLHALWLVGLWYYTLTLGLTPSLGWLAIFVILQGFRVWVIMTLGPRWTTRIIVVPGEELIKRGPYRLIGHPNYAVVMCEIIVLPLAFGLVWFGVVFSVLNAILLWVRVRAEDAALDR
jgi:methyltransferase